MWGGSPSCPAVYNRFMKVWAPLISTASVLGLGLWAFGQQPQAPAPARPAGGIEQADEPTRIQVDVTRVQMLVTVQDKRGRFVMDLHKEDFEVFENKVPQRIQEFTAESDLP